MALLYSEPLSLGWKAPDFELPGTDGKTYSLDNFKDKKGLLIIFTCNHCPYAEAAWPLLIKLHREFGNEIAFVAINPNDSENYPADSYTNMKKKREELNIPFAYLHDESQGVAKKYKAQCTPDPYLFKRENDTFELFYHGQLNDNWQSPEDVNERNLEDAMGILLNDQSPPTAQPPSMGCSIKWTKA